MVYKQKKIHIFGLFKNYITITKKKKRRKQRKRIMKMKGVGDLPPLLILLYNIAEKSQK